MTSQDIIDAIHVQDVPAGDRLLVLPFTKAIQSVIVITDENRERPECGIVLAIGPGGVGSETGRVVPIHSRVGHLAWFGRYSGLNFDLQGPTGPVPVLVMRDAEVLLRRDQALYELEVHDDDLRKVHLKGLTCEFCPGADLSKFRAEMLDERREAERIGATGLSPGLMAGEIQPEPAEEPSTLIEAERERLRQERAARESEMEPAHDAT